jgi:hypothetical protein
MHTSRHSLRCLKACRSYRAEIQTPNGEAVAGQGLRPAELWTLTVRLKDLPLDFTLGPNARFAKMSARPVKDMLDTLRMQPEAFVLNNNGIMLVAKSLKAEGDEVEIVCAEPDEDDEDMPGHGVLNGGHTYLALRQAFADPKKYPFAPDLATVVLTVALNVEEEDIWKISKARNTSEKVPLYALRNLAGDWSDLKAHLPPDVRQRVAFKPNEPEREDAEFDATDLVRRLAIFNNNLFPAVEGQHPVKAYTAIGALVKQYKPEEFKALAPLLPDILKLEELIVKHYEKVNGIPAKGEGKLAVFSKASGCSPQPMTLLTGYTTQKLSLAAPFILPVLAAFRVFLRDDHTWVQAVEELWEAYGPRTVKNLWDQYNETGRSSASAFGRSKASWAAACDHTKMVAIQQRLIRVA